MMSMDWVECIYLCLMGFSFQTFWEESLGKNCWGKIWGEEFLGKNLWGRILGEEFLGKNSWGRIFGEDFLG